MEAVFKISVEEFNEQLFEKIKSLLAVDNDLEVTISIQDAKSKGILRDETKDEYVERLLNARKNLDTPSNAISFKPTELENFKNELLAEK